MPAGDGEDPPGLGGFEIARVARRSRVQRVDGDLLMSDDPEAFGSFDVVLALDALDRVESPLDALNHVRRVTAGLAVIECETAVLPGDDGLELDGELAMCEFVAPREQGNEDPRVFIPSLAALRALCQCAGFSEVETFVDSSREVPTAGESARRRAVVHARPRPRSDARVARLAARMHDLQGSGCSRRPSVQPTSCLHRSYLHFSSVGSPAALARSAGVLGGWRCCASTPWLHAPTSRCTSGST